MIDLMTTAPRPQRRSHESRRRLVAAATVEFAAHGFDGASTRAIAERAGMHQPQINYHFESKDALWRAVVDDLFGALQRALAEIEVTSDDPRELLATNVRAFVRFAAEHPELNRIMMQESTSDSERLEWVVETHVRPVHRAMTSVWSLLADAGLVAPVDGTIAYYLLVGAASFIYVASPELRRLTGMEPTPDLVEAHADAVVTMLFGLPTPPPDA